jgi:hypothetical protein
MQISFLPPARCTSSGLRSLAGAVSHALFCAVRRRRTKRAFSWRRCNTGQINRPLSSVPAAPHPALYICGGSALGRSPRAIIFAAASRSGNSEPAGCKISAPSRAHVITKQMCDSHKPLCVLVERFNCVRARRQQCFSDHAVWCCAVRSLIDFLTLLLCRMRFRTMYG